MKTANWKRSVQLLTGIIAMGALCAACGDAKPPVKTDDDAVNTSSVKRKPPEAGTDPTATQSAVSISESILKACGDIPAAHFAFDSAEVQPDAASALDALARCFVSGPLKGKSMKLVGHADPRGETEYNLALGQHRAGSVADFLMKKGMEQGHLLTSSKGAFEATGTDEAGWAKDRKVEVLLAE